MTTKAAIEMLQLQTKECLGYQKLERSKEGSSLRSFGGSMALRTPRFQTSNLQNCERLNFCYCMSSSFYGSSRKLTQKPVCWQGLGKHKDSQGSFANIAAPMLLKLCKADLGGCFHFLKCTYSHKEGLDEYIHTHISVSI